LVRRNDGNVSLNVTLAQRFERIDGAILSPMEARLDLSVRQGLATSGENLALGFRMGTYETPHLEDHSWHEACSCFAADEHEINITASGEGSASTVFFSWSNKAVAGGKPYRRAPLQGAVVGLAVLDTVLLANVLLAAVSVFALALTVIAILAYRRTRDSHLVFLASAFGAFFVKGLLLTIFLFAGNL